MKTEGVLLYLGNTNAYIDELWSVPEGLKLAKAHGYASVELNVDYEVIVNCLNDTSLGSAHGWSLVQRIRALLESSWQVRIRHVYKEANKVAAELANMGCDLGSGVMIYDSPPHRVVPLILADVMGVSTPRVISM